jgi:hypothetical protein
MDASYEIDNDASRDGDWVDIGHDHQISLRWVALKRSRITADGIEQLEPKLILAGLRDRHGECERGISGWIPFNNAEEPFDHPDDQGWHVDNWDPEHLTLSPSLLCMTCGDHGFIRDNRWVLA